MRVFSNHRRPSSALLAGVAALQVFALGATASAQVVRFEWVRSEEASACPSAPVLRARVAQRLTQNPFVDGPATQIIDGVAERDESGRWLVRLFNRDGDGRLTGSRELTSDSSDCVSLAGAVVLAVALAIDPEAALTPPPPSSTDEEPSASSLEAPETSSSEANSSEESVAPDSSAAESPLSRIRLGAAASFSWGLVPGFGPGLEVGGDVRLYGPLQLSIGIAFVPEQRTSAADSSFGFGVTAPWVGVCLRHEKARWAIDGCLRASIGALYAVVYAPEPTRPGARVYAAADLSLAAFVTIAGPVYAGLSARLSAPFQRPAFRVEGEPVEFQQAIVIPSVALSLGVHFY